MDSINAWWKLGTWAQKIGKRVTRTLRARPWKLHSYEQRRTRMSYSIMGDSLTTEDFSLSHRRHRGFLVTDSAAARKWKLERTSRPVSTSSSALGFGIQRGGNLFRLLPRALFLFLCQPMTLERFFDCAFSLTRGSRLTASPRNSKRCFQKLEARLEIALLCAFPAPLIGGRGRYRDYR